MCRAGDPPVQAVERRCPDAAWQTHAIGDLGDGADRGVFAVVPRHEEHALLVADVGGDGDVHVRKDDDVVKRNEQQRAHQRSSLSFVSYENQSSYKR